MSQSFSNNFQNIPTGAIFKSLESHCIYLLLQKDPNSLNVLRLTRQHDQPYLGICEIANTIKFEVLQ